jgi:hypothetical protein
MNHHLYDYHILLTFPREWWLIDSSRWNYFFQQPAIPSQFYNPEFDPVKPQLQKDFLKSPTALKLVNAYSTADLGSVLINLFALLSKDRTWNPDLIVTDILLEMQALLNAMFQFDKLDVKYQIEFLIRTGCIDPRLPAPHLTNRGGLLGIICYGLSMFNGYIMYLSHIMNTNPAQPITLRNVSPQTLNQILNRSSIEKATKTVTSLFEKMANKRR